jgi:hypothetical protein
MRTIVRSLAVLALASTLVAGCGAAATTTATATATPSPAPTVSPVLEPTATPIPTTDGQGPEYAFGIESFTVTKDATETVVGDVTQLRGQEMVSADTLNDPRVTATGLITLNADIHGTVVVEWGTTRLENAGGAWEGTWTGAGWGSANATSVSGWLIGSGAYAGYTYYVHVYGPSEPPYQIEGIIFPGSPPTP